MKDSFMNSGDFEKEFRRILWNDTVQRPIRLSVEIGEFDMTGMKSMV